jgi:hypothetical protein
MTFDSENSGVSSYDDSGTKEYYKNPNIYERDPHTRYFVFGAVLIEESKISVFVERIREKKCQYFGTGNVEIKSNWIRIPKERKAHYIEKFSITEDSLKKFVEEIYEIICNTNLQLIGAVVDKKQVIDMYPNPWYSPAIGYEILMQRVVQEIVMPNRVRVVVDDITGATPKGHQYKKNLETQHDLLKRRGSILIKTIPFNSMYGRIKFINSKFSNQIQIADIVAYDIFRQFVDYGEEWEVPTEQKALPTYSYFMRICDKFRKGPGDRIQGFGIIKFPMIKRVRWSLRKRKTAP